MKPLINGKPWAMLPAVLKAFAMSDSSEQAQERDPLQPGRISVIRVRGPLSHGDPFASWFGGTDMEGIGAAFDMAMEDHGTVGVVLDIDSPGGDVNGTASLAEKIYAARGKKPIAAYVSGTAASAAYWIGSAADKMVANPAAMVGSIGVYATLIDQSKMLEAVGIDIYQVVSSQSPKKVPDPSTDEGYAQVQREVDALADVFISSVAKYRGVAAADVRKKYGQGDVLIGNAAKAAGMVDAIGSLEDCFAAIEKMAEKKVDNGTMSTVRRAEYSKQRAQISELFGKCAAKVGL